MVNDLCLGKGLVEVGEDVVDMLNADGEADKFWADTTGELLLGGELRMGRGGRVNRQRLGVTKVGNVGEQLERVDKLCSRFCSTFNSKDNNASTFTAEVFLVFGEFRIVLEPGEADPFDAGVTLEMFGDCEGVFAVAFHAERQGFDALEKLPGIVGRDAGSEVAEWDSAHAQNVGQRSEHLGEVMAPAEAVVGVIGIVEERVLAAAPVEAAGIDDDATKACAVSTKPLGEGVDDDVGTVIEGIGEVWSRAGGIDDKGNAVFLCDGSYGIEVGNFEGGIGNGFTKEGASLVVNGVGELPGILRVDKADLDPKRGKDVVELGVAATIKIAGGDNVIASLGEVDDGIKNRGGAGGVSEAGEFVGPFKQANALFQDIGGGIHQPGVNVP